MSDRFKAIEPNPVIIVLNLILLWGAYKKMPVTNKDIINHINHPLALNPSPKKTLLN